MGEAVSVTTEEEISEFLVKVLGVCSQADALDPDARLVEDYGVDSAGIFELILWLEDRFGVRVEPSDMTLSHFSTIRAAAAFVHKAQRRDPTLPCEP